MNVDGCVGRADDLLKVEGGSVKDLHVDGLFLVNLSIKFIHRSQHMILKCVHSGGIPLCNFDRFRKYKFLDSRKKEFDFTKHTMSPWII